MQGLVIIGDYIVGKIYKEVKLSLALLSYLFVGYQKMCMHVVHVYGYSYLFIYILYIIYTIKHMFYGLYILTCMQRDHQIYYILLERPLQLRLWNCVNYIYIYTYFTSVWMPASSDNDVQLNNKRNILLLIMTLLFFFFLNI